MQVEKGNTIELKIPAIWFLATAFAHQALRRVSEREAERDTGAGLGDYGES